MFEQLIRELKAYAAISDSDLQKIISSLKIREVKKRKNILNEGDNCHHIFYLNRGLCRYYINDGDGIEHTIDLIAPHNWFGDTKAFLLQESAMINIEALEDSQIFAISYEDVNRFYDEIPLFERATRKITEHYFIKALDRCKRNSRLGKSAQIRYQEFITSHPDLENRVPAIYLASYLGLAPETLSRLRHQHFKIQ
jgi:CRP-like cAMP-binding protein